MLHVVTNVVYMLSSCARRATTALGVLAGLDKREQQQQQQQPQLEQDMGQWSELSSYISLAVENQLESFLARLPTARRARYQPANDVPTMMYLGLGSAWQINWNAFWQGYMPRGSRALPATSP